MKQFVLPVILYMCNNTRTFSNLLDNFVQEETRRNIVAPRVEINNITLNGKVRNASCERSSQGRREGAPPQLGRPSINQSQAELEGSSNAG